MKKLIALVLAMVMLFAFAGCGAADTSSDADDAAAKLTVGFIFLHDE